MKHKYLDTVETLEDRPQEWLDEINGYISLQALRSSSSGMSMYDWRVKKE